MLREQGDFHNQTFAWWIGRIGGIILQANQKSLERLYENGMTIFEENYDYTAEYILVKPESYLYGVLNDYILQWREYGFEKYFESMHLFDKPIVDAKDPRKVLTMYMLSAGLYLWLTSVGIACIVFAAERVVKYLADYRHSESQSKVEVFEDQLEYDVERHNEIV